MKLHAYCLPPIDFFWGARPLERYVEDLVTELLPQDAERAPQTFMDYASELGSRLTYASELWEQAQRVAKDEIGWEGDIRTGPYVILLPVDELEFGLGGFVWKQDNNGTTFVVSTVSLPWLQAHAFDYKVVSRDGG